MNLNPQTEFSAEANVFISPRTKPIVPYPQNLHSLQSLMLQTREVVESGMLWNGWPPLGEPPVATHYVFQT